MNKEQAQVVALIESLRKYHDRSEFIEQAANIRLTILDNYTGWYEYTRIAVYQMIQHNFSEMSPGQCYTIMEEVFHKMMERWKVEAEVRELITLLDGLAENEEDDERAGFLASEYQDRLLELGYVVRSDYDSVSDEIKFTAIRINEAR